MWPQWGVDIPIFPTCHLGSRESAVVTTNWKVSFLQGLVLGTSLLCNSGQLSLEYTLQVAQVDRGLVLFFWSPEAGTLQYSMGDRVL